MIFIVFKVNAEYTLNKFNRRRNYEKNQTHTVLSIVNYKFFGKCCCGWAYENRFNYTIMTLTILLIIIAPTIYAWKKRKTNLKKAYIILSIPALVYLARYIYFTNFFNI